jgi:predicted nucleic acid-binding protein
LNVVDSSGWLEYFADGGNADIFAEPLQDIANVLVPAICYYEVFKVVLRERNESDALQVLALMHQGITIEISSDIAVQAAKNSLQYRLPMADSIIFTVAQQFDSTLWTQDVDFKNLAGVRYIPKK